MIENISTVATITELTVKLVRTVSKATYYFNYLKSPLKIAVFGSSGSGKSSFLSTFKGVEFPKESTRQIEKIKFTLPNGRRIIFYDSPGQTSYRLERTKIKSSILQGEFHAIINIVCFGYNETPTMKINAFHNDGSIRQQFLEDNRKIEIRHLQEWIEDIDKNSRIDWILTLINKEDIWKDQQEEVVSYYQSNEYQSHFNGLTRCCHHHIQPYCATISPFGGKPMVLHISESDKIKHFLSLVDKLQEFTKKH